MPNTHISLAGEWDFRFEDEPTWSRLHVPCSWETLDGAKNRSGPALYRTWIAIPPEATGQRIMLECAAVSYACEVLIDGQPVGTHIGVWDAFSIDLTSVAKPGTTHELCIRVEKPAALVAGPDSASLAGRFPLRTTLSGFLPYVWGQIFGGIWQDLWLVTSGPTLIEELSAEGTPDGQIVITATVSGHAAALDLTIRDPDGHSVFSQILMIEPAEGHAEIRAKTTIANPRPWSPADPALYTLYATLNPVQPSDSGAPEAGDELTRRFGLREIRTVGTDILLNGQPIYPRMVLSWGWYEGILCPNPGPQRVRADMLKLQSLGYNGIKLCLWFPPEYYFELADELGMLLWVEFPMWLPQPNTHFLSQVSIEYERLVRQAAKHPSVLLYSLGCELNRQVGPDILEPLYTMVKQHARGALVRDNSGSGEAYGGLLNEHADYYDYHFYSELHLFRALLDHFAPRWRPVQPWVFGEFCDYDSMRNPARTAAEWWMSQNPQINPQGARWQFDTPWLESRMRANGLWERRSDLEAISYQHALLHRKWTLECVRMYREIGGYVITGEADTPISTAGMWDEHGQLKFAPDAFRAFNQDLVALVGWDKRRAWVNGGDRAAPWDVWSYRSGAVVRPHIVVSNYLASQAEGLTHTRWQVVYANGEEIAAGELHSPALPPGELREIGIAEFRAPQLQQPRRAELRVTITMHNTQTSNSWPLWFFPESGWPSPGSRTEVRPTLALHDPRNLLSGIERYLQLPATGPGNLDIGHVQLCTTWSPQIEAFVRSGGQAVLLEQGAGEPGPLPVVAMPFWREAIRICEEHPAWGNFPQDGWAALQFLACATDRALDYSAYPDTTPIFLRIDTRTAATHAYIAERKLGAGRVIITTLRLYGGHGEQPMGIANSPAALWLLGCLVGSM